MKIAHPHWNGTGKSENEAIFLRRARRLGVRAPRVLAHTPRQSGTLPVESLGKEWTEVDLSLLEVIVMEHVEGESLGEIWPALSWEERKSFIVQVVDELALLKKDLCFSSIGACAAETPGDASLQSLCEACFGWREVADNWTDSIQPTLNTFLTWSEDRPEGDIQSMRSVAVQCLASPLLQASSPINALPKVLCSGDVAPKNVLVREGSVVALVDFEWGRVVPFGIDVGEMIYPLSPGATENESFTDSSDVPYDVQRDFVRRVWAERVEVELDFDLLDMREAFESVACHLALLTSEEATDVKKEGEAVRAAALKIWPSHTS